jgi:hypothetical protein
MTGKVSGNRVLSPPILPFHEGVAPMALPLEGATRAPVIAEIGALVEAI